VARNPKTTIVADNVRVVRMSELREMYEAEPNIAKIARELGFKSTAYIGTLLRRMGVEIQHHPPPASHGRKQSADEIARRVAATKGIDANTDWVREWKRAHGYPT
jgi:hypothetical protein